MKYFGVIQVFALALLAVLLTSCSSTAPSTTARRFNEGASANMVLRSYTWNSIHMTRPDTREGGYLPLMSRDEVAREVARRQVPRDLAVVTIGAAYGPDQLAVLARDWKQFLAAQGFRRVVILRSGFKQEIDGLLVVDDSVIAGANDTPGNIAAPFAAVPTATGADAAYPPITANR
jgi:hypothetical protein